MAADTNKFRGLLVLAVLGVLLAAGRFAWHPAPAPASANNATPTPAAAESATAKPVPAVSRPAAGGAVVRNVEIRDLHGRVVFRGDVDLGPTLARIGAGLHAAHRNDGTVFNNYPPPGKTEPLLPKRPRGYYHEYVHPTPGLSGPGPQRVILGENGEAYYTPDHYNSFVKIRAGP